MPNTLNIETIRAGFAERNYTLLSTEYINSKQKLQYECPVGHIGTISWGDFRANRGCPKCWENRKREQKLTPIETLRANFLARGYTLLTKAYTNGKQILEATCPRSHHYITTVRKWNCGFGCAQCAAIDNCGANNPNWNSDREAVIHNKKVWTAWRNLLRAGVSNNHRKTSAEISVILGYEWSDLRRHVQSHPQWESCKDDYQIDHIFPVKAFRDYGISDPKIVNALDNLRPLSKTENFRKNKFYDRIAFERYLQSKGIQWQKQPMTALTSGC